MAMLILIIYGMIGYRYRIHKEMYMKTFGEFAGDVEKYSLELKHPIRLYRLNFRHANGCGAKGGMKFPNTMWGVNIVAACIIHDIEWQLATNFKELVAANERFDNNLKRITDYNSSNSITTWLRRMRVAKYVIGVEIHGTRDYANERGFEIC